MSLDATVLKNLCLALVQKPCRLMGFLLILKESHGVSMDPVHDRESMDPVNESGPWTQSKHWRGRIFEPIHSITKSVTRAAICSKEGRFLAECLNIFALVVALFQSHSGGYEVISEFDNIDYGNDWKLLTMWIETEDICHICTDMDKLGPRSFNNNNNVPRLFVNLVPPMDMCLLYELHGG
ncbi:unnamed protein product [Porites lobata]|uniref:Uncharacterized protein n=1 Tax=Porites lobata TaxID=104759 RepID=A0ABN8S8Z0_9CNID|nr:unnamed protein product [Porites lobata]